MKGKFLMKLHGSNVVTEIPRDKGLYFHLEYYRVYGGDKNASIKMLRRGHRLVTPHSTMWFEARANIACTGQLAGAGKADGESTPSANCQ